MLQWHISACSDTVTQLVLQSNKVDFVSLGTAMGPDVSCVNTKHIRWIHWLDLCYGWHGLGLILGTEAPVMMRNSIDFFSVLAWVSDTNDLLLSCSHDDCKSIMQE